MLALGPNTEIFLVQGPTDMRKSFDTLAALVRNELQRDPLSGQLFVFSNKKHDRLKILLYDRGGYWLLSRRLERGTFAWPDTALQSIELSAEELTLLLGGIDLAGATQRRWYRRAQ